MKKNKLVSLLIGVVFIISSCQREFDDPDPNTVVSSTVFISKMIALDTTKLAPIDTVEKISFSYDNSRRLTKILNRFFGLYPGSKDSTRYHFFYQGNDSLPYKYVYERFHTGGGNYVDTSFLTYNNSIIAKDSTIHWYLTGGQNNGVGVNSYSVTGNTIVRRVKDYYLLNGQYNLAFDISNTYIVTYTGQNITGQIQSTSPPTGYSRFQAVYDTRPNPLRIIKLRYPMIENNSFSDFLLQQNTLLSAQFEYGGTPAESETWMYNYGTNNYPISSKLNFSGVSPNHRKILYYYTTL